MTTPSVDVDAEINRLHRTHPARSGLLFNIVITVIEVGGAILLFKVARSAGISDVGAYLIGSIAPVVGAIAIWIRSRRFSGASGAIFAFTLLSAVVAIIGSTEPKVLLYKDCATTAVIGLIFAGSCLVTRPLIFYFTQRYGSDGSREGMRAFDMMWENYPMFRRAIYHISIVWAAAFLIQAGVTSLIIASTSFDTAYTWDQVLPYVAIGLAIAVTMVIGKRMQAEGEQRSADRRAAQAATPDTTTPTDPAAPAT